MNLDDYQKAARATAIYKGAIVYPTLGLAGETGEVSELVKKWLRDEGGADMSPERRGKLDKELGDVLWYVSNLCSDLGLSLSEVAAGNVEKLADRKSRGVLKGDGDDR